MSASRDSRPSLLRRLLRSRDGSTAVEFAMVITPFCVLIFSILELGMVFVIDSVLENATIESGRLIRTGQAENQGMTPAQFKNSICSRMSVFSADCDSRLFVDVRELPRFDADPGDPISNGEFNETGLGYTDGQPSSLMLVRVWYKQPLLTTYLAQGLGRLNDGKAVLTAATAFRNEPR